jgi:hypothetical protein
MLAKYNFFFKKVSFLEQLEQKFELVLDLDISFYRTIGGKLLPDSFREKNFNLPFNKMVINNSAVDALNELFIFQLFLNILSLTKVES